MAAAAVYPAPARDRGVYVAGVPWTRKRMLVLAATAVLGVGSAVAGAYVATTTGEYAESAGWSLLGVRDGGRTLLVRGPDHGGCDRVRAVADESDPERVTVTAEILFPRGTIACNLILFEGEPIAVRLRRPLVGRAVVGPKRKLHPLLLRAVDIDDQRRPQPPDHPYPVPERPPPSVVGLRYRDARHALCNSGFQARRASDPQANGMVVRQEPAVRQPTRGRSRYATCSNGILPAVRLTATAR